MDILRKSEAIWNGDLISGDGQITFGSGAYKGPYSFKGRTTEQTQQTNPEELIAAAHAGCFSMALSALLTKLGHPPKKIQTIAKVHLISVSDGLEISEIELETVGDVPGMSAEDFQKHAETTKQTCPVSKALKAVSMKLKATLNNT